MRTTEFHEIAKTKLNKCSINELKKEAIKYNSIYTDEATYLFDAIIDVLESKMSENDFIEFCNNL